MNKKTNFEIPVKGMISSQYEVAIRTYKKLKGKSGRNWYVALQENQADNIYVSAHPKENQPEFKGFRGFGGSTLTFKLEDGTEDKVTGPWHSNTSSLFDDTKYDIRDKHLIFGVISRSMKRVKNAFNPIMEDVIYKDEKPMLGPFNRIKKMAEEIANKEGKPVYYYSESKGGSSRAQVKPFWMKVIE